MDIGCGASYKSRECLARYYNEAADRHAIGRAFNNGNVATDE